MDTQELLKISADNTEHKKHKKRTKKIKAQLQEQVCHFFHENCLKLWKASCPWMAGGGGGTPT